MITLNSPILPCRVRMDRLMASGPSIAAMLATISSRRYIIFLCMYLCCFVIVFAVLLILLYVMLSNLIE